MIGDVKKGRSGKGGKKPAALVSQGVALGDLLGKKLEQVKRNREEEIKQMVREARNNPEVQKSTKKFAVSTEKAIAKPTATSKPSVKRAAK